MISRKMMTKIFLKKFSRMRKNGFKEALPALPSREFFHVYKMSNHTVFLVQFGINLDE